MPVPISKAAWAALAKHSDDDCELQAMLTGTTSRTIQCLTHGDVLCEVIEREDDGACSQLGQCRTFLRWAYYQPSGEGDRWRSTVSESASG